MKKILFLCASNATRSQMAEGMARKALADRFEVYSAGIQPIAMHPLAVKIMNEIGIDISGQKSKSINDVPWKEMDMIVTLCGTSSKSLPTLPPTIERLHWPVPDPVTMTSHYGFKSSAEGKQIAFKEVRDMLQKRMEEFVQEHK
ncbi:arsenate reductase ArsC [Candidatus Manganitrophus noduliformans]|uniref:Arsenate reductase ArsC n=1 Tax=Candidatus Manganitrophus noduliformans TaxID=2606439 RepID=A0A7X6IAP8_9BACT|nr:arsenate reductase ArsC [Candidatus Manganitrophus noduliformans]NKE70946.1 arsenate reductase ArsC [Candidatus Manganitrophus noduliformans]